MQSLLLQVLTYFSKKIYLFRFIDNTLMPKKWKDRRGIAYTPSLAHWLFLNNSNCTTTFFLFKVLVWILKKLKRCYTSKIIKILNFLENEDRGEKMIFQDSKPPHHM